MNGHYEEQLKAAGSVTFTFTVTAEDWSIRFYFPGPDARYNGTWLTIRGNNVQTYINAYRENWEEFQALKSQIPSGGSFRKEGKKGMSINVGSSGIYSNGVCIDGWHLPIDTEHKLDSLLGSFQYCIERAPYIMQWLKNA